jgi:hypothetical protein
MDDVIAGAPAEGRAAAGDETEGVPAEGCTGADDGTEGASVAGRADKEGEGAAASGAVCGAVTAGCSTPFVAG